MSPATHSRQTTRAVSARTEVGVIPRTILHILHRHRKARSAKELHTELRRVRNEATLRAVYKGIATLRTYAFVAPQQILTGKQARATLTGAAAATARLSGIPASSGAKVGRFRITHKGEAVEALLSLKADAPESHRRRTFRRFLRVMQGGDLR